jgi:ferrous-iron efflux pump FieF
LILIKLIAWLITGSASILATLTDSLMDVAASGINLLAIRYATQPADAEHRFGHGKAESLAGLAQAAFISGSGSLLVANGINELLHPKPLSGLAVGIWVMASSIIITLVLVGFQRWVIRKTQSVAIKADSLHYRGDILMNGAVLVALLLSRAGWFWADGVFAVGIGLYLIRGALRIGQEAVQALLDHELPAEDKQRILAEAMAAPGVRGVHELRTRQSGPVVFLQLHLELDDQLRLIEAHGIADQVESRLQKLYPNADIIIHQDPLSIVALERQQSAEPL